MKRQFSLISDVNLQELRSTSYAKSTEAGIKSTRRIFSEFLIKIEKTLPLNEAELDENLQLYWPSLRVCKTNEDYTAASLLHHRQLLEPIDLDAFMSVFETNNKR